MHPGSTASLPALTYALGPLNHYYNERNTAAEDGSQHGGGAHHGIHPRLHVPPGRQHLQPQQPQQHTKGAADEDAGPAGVTFMSHNQGVRQTAQSAGQ